MDPCPAEEVFAIVAGKWKARILLQLWLDPSAFAELRRALPGISQQVLSTQLKALERDGVIARAAGGGQAPGPYVLSPEGAALMPALSAVAAWGEARLLAKGVVWRPPTRVRGADQSGRPASAGTIAAARS
jgi:DNA-binding HxlR family transcriptional regulator